MKIFPALDIRNGKCVRLIKGNYNNEIIFDENPIDVAMKFEEDGSKYIHIIDLGTGAGLPGVVLAIVNYSNVFLIDSNIKKIKFLKHIAKELNLSFKIFRLGGRIKNVTIDKSLISFNCFVPCQSMSKSTSWPLDNNSNTGFFNVPYLLSKIYAYS